MKRKKSGINVEYVHINALMGWVSSMVIGAILDAKLPKHVEKATVLAFNKLLWIQNDFFAKYYVTEAGKEAVDVQKHVFPDGVNSFTDRIH